MGNMLAATLADIRLEGVSERVAVEQHTGRPFLERVVFKELQLARSRHHHGLDAIRTPGGDFVQYGADVAEEERQLRNLDHPRPHVEIREGVEEHRVYVDEFRVVIDSDLVSRLQVDRSLAPIS